MDRFGAEVRLGGTVTVNDGFNLRKLEAFEIGQQVDFQYGAVMLGAPLLRGEIGEVVVRQVLEAFREGTGGAESASDLVSFGLVAPESKKSVLSGGVGFTAPLTSVINPANSPILAMLGGVSHRFAMRL